MKMMMCILAMCLGVVQAETAAPVADRPVWTKEPVTQVQPDGVIVRTIPLGEGCFVRFHARTIDVPDAERTLSDRGYCVYEGKLWDSLASPPRIILTRGVFFDGEREVELDVSGMADPWVNADELEARNGELEIWTEDHRELATLKVAFTKGGAEDYIVTWVVKDGLSLRISIEGVGDTLPEWMENPKTSQGRYEVGNALWGNGEHEEAREWWRQAAAEGHAGAKEALKKHAASR